MLLLGIPSVMWLYSQARFSEANKKIRVIATLYLYTVHEIDNNTTLILFKELKYYLQNI